MLKCSYAEMH